MPYVHQFYTQTTVFLGQIIETETDRILFLVLGYSNLIKNVLSVEYSRDASFPISLPLPRRMNQIELNDLIRDLNLLKDQSEVLASSSILSKKVLLCRENLL